MAVTAASADGGMLFGAAATIGVAGIVLFHRFPRVAVAAWLAALCLVPYWFGVTITYFYLSPTALVGLLVVVSLIRLRRPQLGVVDAVVVLLLGVYVLATVVSSSSPDAGFQLLGTWTLGYILGRLAVSRTGPEFVYTAVAVVFAIVAVLAVVEFLSGYNLFVHLTRPNAAFHAWGAIQVRGGIRRTEGAFGHSIALGSSLALALPLVLAARFRLWIRAAIVVAMLAAVVLTFSRVSMIGAVLSLILSVIFLRKELSGPMRAAVIFILLSGLLAAAPFVTTVFSDAGTEATNSSSYRGNLLSLVPDMQIIGLSPSYTVAANGRPYFGSFQSIDSALILFGLNYGLLPLIVIVAVLLGCIAFVVSGRATPPTIAIVAAIPSLATVALITQFAMFVWVMAGLAVGTQFVQRQPGEWEPDDRPIGYDGLRAASPRASSHHVPLRPSMEPTPSSTRNETVR